MSTLSDDDAARRCEAAAQEVHRLLVIAAMERDDPERYAEAIRAVHAYIESLDSDAKDDLVAGLLWPDARDEADALTDKAKEHIEAAFSAPPGYAGRRRRGWLR